MKSIKAFSEAIIYADVNDPIRKSFTGKKGNLLLMVIIAFNLLAGPWFFFVTKDPAVLTICYTLTAVVGSLLFYRYAQINRKLLLEVEAEKEQMERELVKALHANDCKKSFFREMVHEIKSGFNPIEGMIGYLGESERLQKTKASVAELIGHIKSGCFGYRRLLSNLLEFSKIEHGKQEDPIIEPLELRSFMQQIVDEFQYTASTEKTYIVLQVEENMPPIVYCDGIRLRQIANNLIHNAIKFVKEDCDVLVKVELNGLHAWQLTVINDGEYHIPEEKIQELFHPYQHVLTGINMERNGLGLFITRKLVESLQGDIKVVPGKSLTVFEARFPLEPNRCNSLIPQTRDRVGHGNTGHLEHNGNGRQ